MKATLSSIIFTTAESRDARQLFSSASHCEHSLWLDALGLPGTARPVSWKRSTVAREVLFTAAASTEAVEP